MVDPNIVAGEWGGRTIDIVIDRPLGSAHPDHGFQYPINYGYVPNTAAGDGEPIDVYVIDATEPLSRCQGVVIAIIRRNDDAEDKLVASLGKASVSAERIRELTSFQERFFDSHVEMLM